MAHTRESKKTLLARTRRIRGQVEAIEKALAEEQECADLLQLIAAARGAINGLSESGRHMGNRRCQSLPLAM